MVFPWKTEVTRRCGWPASALLWSRFRCAGTPCARQMLLGLSFRAYSGQVCFLCCHLVIWTANRWLKQAKPWFSLGKTEVTRRSNWPTWALLGFKIPCAGPPGAHQMLPGLAFPVYSGYVCSLCRQSVHAIDFIANRPLKQAKPWFSLGKMEVTRRSHCDT